MGVHKNWCYAEVRPYIRKVPRNFTTLVGFVNALVVAA